WVGGACTPSCSAIVGDPDACNGQLGCLWVGEVATGTCTVNRLETRWQQALAALDDVVSGYSGRIRFGLSYYPDYCVSPPAQYTPECRFHGNSCWCNSQSCNDCSGYGTAAECRTNDSCTWSGSCLNGGNCQPGVPDVVAGEHAVGDIMSPLYSIFPGGGTPTGPTLRGVRDARASFGMSVGVDCEALASGPCGTEPLCGWNAGTGTCVSHCELIMSLTDCGLASDCVWDTASLGCLKQQDRGDYVLLVTDGEANCDDDCATATGTNEATCIAVAQGCVWSPAGSRCSMGASSSWYPDHVNSALDDLRALTPAVKTYIVGFAFSTVSANLNCHAVHGGTARPDTCAGVDGSTCDEAAASGNACYYDASDAATLATALGNILGTVALCSVTVEGLRSDDFAALGRTNVYLNYTDGSGTEWIARDIAGLNAWDFDLSDTYARINFAGAACDVIRAGTVTPLIIIGCPPEGG
ncbi:MAG: hypothetical protein AAB426_14190, partial [Myxococcota bacterium]